MPTFLYSAIDATGTKKTGKIEASSPDEANAKLSQMCLMVANMAAEGGGKAAKGGAAGGAAKKGGG